MSDGQFGTLRYEIRHGGAWIILTRPERRNALDPDLISDLGTAIDTAQRDSRARSVVVTGTEDAFCAGADLRFIQSLDSPAAIVEYFLQPLTKVLRSIRDLSKPVIAAINGHCVAGGLELALCCDLILAATTARIADGHSRFGLLPAIGGANALTRAFGPYRAKEMLFLGEAFTGEQLHQLGLVNRAVPAEELDTVTSALVATLATRSPSGLARMKQMVNEGGEVTWDLAARRELTLTEAHLAAGDPGEGLAAFTEKRVPVFGSRR
ncbi:hypothetical protein CcI49_11500 [Frankia sp. CcI49]|uniref:enoyl-CoA hydratase/isomerase family protein n=1 Tax=Frankia sp. CcI49 TaxID=1745382 RepID=UPI000978322E|nr:enoyl-CoA hydratase/isomerase family protein [Frankia sp. CcI49]ONH60450.1 hypothetical protein CcI49_11500 [Frankia sp. CcI49]